MANNNNNKTLNVPNMRFPEFSGEWKIETLNNIATFVGGGTPTSSNQSFWNGSIPWVSSSDIKEDCIHEITKTRFITNEAINKSATKLCQAPVVMLVSRVGVGKVALSNEDLCTSQDFCNMTEIKCEPTFLAYELLRIMKRKSREVQGTSIKGITSSEIQKFILYVPQKEEQTKISTLLALLDERIATQNKIIEDLKKLKSAIIDRIFCYPKENEPSVRLNKYSKKWALVKLSDITERVKTKNMASQCSQVLTIAAQYGLVSQTSFFNKSVASENLSGYFLLQKGDFAYNKSYSGEYPWGTIKRLELYTQGVLSPLYICFKINEKKVCSDYLAHYYESKKWYKGIANIAGEGARNHRLLNISVGDFFNTTHRIPDTNEQNSIAIILNKISTKLKIEQKYIQLYLEQRNYLLQQMFI